MTTREKAIREAIGLLTQFRDHIIETADNNDGWDGALVHRIEAAIQKLNDQLFNVEHFLPPEER